MSHRGHRARTQRSRRLQRGLNFGVVRSLFLCLFAPLRGHAFGLIELLPFFPALLFKLVSTDWRAKATPYLEKTNAEIPKCRNSDRRSHERIKFIRVLCCLCPSCEMDQMIGDRANGPLSSLLPPVKAILSALQAECCASSAFVSGSRRSSPIKATSSSIFGAKSGRGASTANWCALSENFSALRYVANAMRSLPIFV